MNADTWLATTLWATEMPIETPAPTPPPTPAAMDAAAATALIIDASVAVMLIEPAEMPSVAVAAPSPSIAAVTRVEIWLSAETPAPPTPMPTAPPATAIAPAKTSELIV